MSPVEERQNTTQPLALLVGGAALTLLLQVTPGILGVAGFFLVLFVAVPAAYVFMRCGALVATGTVLLATLGSYLFDGFYGMAGYLLQFGMISLLLPFLLRRNWRWGHALGAAVAVISAVLFVVLFGSANVTGVSVSEQVAALANAQVEQAIALYTTPEMAPEQANELKSSFEKMADSISYAYPGLVVAVTGFMALLLLWLLSVLAKNRYQISGQPFATWKAPELLVWLLIGAGFVFFFFEGLLKQISANLLIILLPIYFLQGLAIVNYFFNRRQVPPFMRGLGYVLIVFLSPVPLILTGIGVFDLWIDFRKPRVKET